MKARSIVSALLLVLCAVVSSAAQPGPGVTAYRVKLVLYPGDDGAAVAKRLAAMYRGTLETPVDADGGFVIALSAAAARLMGRDPAVQRFEVAEPTAAAPSVPETTAVATPWKLGNYEYDGSGNIRRMGADFFVYDTRNRLVVSADASASPIVHQQTYAYDTFGNQTAINTAGIGQTTLTVDRSSNQVTAVSSGAAAVSPAYDATGNLTQYGTATYAYDALNVLTRSTIDGVTRYYVYSASDERIGTVEVSAAGTRSDWTIRDADGRVLRRFSRESNGEWKWQEDYVYRGSQMLAAEVPDSSKTRHFHLDHLGTPRLITGNGGVEISRHNYHPFGVEIAPASETSAATAREKKQFTGHERDAESLDYMHARFYAPYMGRFLSVDPVLNIEGSIRKPQAWNRYAYVMNNPIRYMDPDGRECGGCLAFERDNQDLLHDKISVEEFNARNEARANGALLGLTVLDGYAGVRGLLVGGVGLYRGYQAYRAIEAAKAAGVFVGKYGSDMAPKAVGFLARMSGDGALKAQVFEKMANMISKLSPGWGASKAVAVDGSHVFTGTAGETLVINAKGEVFRGGINAIKQTKAGVEVVWDALRRIVPK